MASVILNADFPSQMYHRIAMPNRSIKMKPDEKNDLSSSKCNSRVLSRNNSFEVYYGDAPVGVPFRWESCPGTPRIKSRENQLPPLTPPPSYQSSSASKNNGKKQRKVNFFPKLTVKKSHLQFPPASSSSPSSSSSSSSSSPWSYSSYSAPGSPCALNSNIQPRFSNPRPSLDSRVDDDDDDDRDNYESPCFCVRRSAKARSRGFSSNMVKLLFGESA